VNKFQLTVLIAAMANLALLLLFPPFDSQPLGRIGPANFDAFYPVFDWPARGTLNSGLLYLEIFSVLVSAALAWSCCKALRRNLSFPGFAGRACCNGWSSPLCS